MTVLLYTVHVLTCLFLILVVLLQQGKGADLSVFGGGGTMTAFGARGAASLLHKLTVGGFVLFIVTTLAIGVFESRDSSSVMSDLEEAAAATEAKAETEEPAKPAAALPEAADPELTAAEYDEAAAEATEGEAAPAEEGGSDAPAEEGGSDAPAEEGGGQ